MNHKTIKAILFVLFCGIATCLQAQSLSDEEKLFDPTRIEETNYKLLMYNQSKDSLSNITIIDRSITRETWKSRLCIKITEANNTATPKTETVIYLDAKSLKPLYFESANDNTVVQKAIFENSKLKMVDIENGVEKTTETSLSTHAYSSNSFSELIQANDFGKNRFISFETFSPGKPANQYKVERVDEQQFLFPNGRRMDCWVLKFTKRDSKGVESLGGYRYVDKQSGKVVMYKSDINTDTFFTYQIIFLKV